MSFRRLTGCCAASGAAWPVFKYHHMACFGFFLTTNPNKRKHVKAACVPESRQPASFLRLSLSLGENDAHPNICGAAAQPRASPCPAAVKFCRETLRPRRRKKKSSRLQPSVEQIAANRLPRGLCVLGVKLNYYICASPDGFSVRP